jgi:uncharacterized repeat protein (TIGR03847 family)
MLQADNEYKYVFKVNVQAIGKPGNRTFRIIAETVTASAILWIEKQQLLQLVTGIRQLILATSDRKVPKKIVSELKDTISRNIEFQVGKISIGEDSLTGKLFINAHEINQQINEIETVRLRLWITKKQALDFIEESIAVCEAGRPACQLCGNPIDQQSHICPRTNGHYKKLEEL